MGLSTDCHRITGRRKRRVSQACRKRSAQSEVCKGNPCRPSLVSRTWPSSTEIKPHTAPTSQITKAMASQVVLNRAAMGWLVPEVPCLTLAATVPAGEMGVTEFPAPSAGARLSVSENWLPELISVETDQSGLCQERGKRS